MTFADAPGQDHRIKALVIVLLIFSAPAVRSATLSIDDGTAEQVAGFGSPSDIIAVNSFFSTPSHVFVNSVQIAWGSPELPGLFPNGSAVTIYVWIDPNGDGDPGDAQVVASVEGVVSSVDTNTFITYSFPSAALIPTADFFVGFRATETGFQYPAATDLNSPLPHRSFIAEFDPGAGDPSNLRSGNTSGFLGEGGFLPGNFLIRAGVSTVPESGNAILLMLGSVSTLLLMRRARAR